MEQFNKEDVKKSIKHYDERIEREEAAMTEAEELGDVEAAIQAELELNYLCSNRKQMKDLLGDLLEDESLRSGANYDQPFTD